MSHHATTTTTASPPPVPPPSAHRPAACDAGRGGPETYSLRHLRLLPSPAAGDDEVDRELMRRVAAGDERAFGALFDRTSPLLLSLGLRILGRADEAEEILQETFLAAWQQADRFDPRRARPATWLAMLARSRALDRLRSNRSRHRREEVVECERGPRHEPPVGAGRIEAGERRRHVRRALAELPEVQRRCIELAYFGGLTQNEIAERLDQPLGTVKSRILLGLRRLRHALMA